MSATPENTMGTVKVIIAAVALLGTGGAGGAGGMAALQSANTAALAADVRELREWRAATAERLAAQDKLVQELRDGQKAIISRLDTLVAAKGAR